MQPEGSAAVQDIRGIVFDKDGTLFDFHRTWAAFNARLIADLAGGDTERAAALAEALGFDLEEPRFLPDSPMIAGTIEVVIEAVARILPELDEALVVRQVRDGSHAITPVEAVPLVPLLDGLIHQGLVLGVATNDSEAPARAHLASLGVLDRFAFVAGYDSGHGAKPAPGHRSGCLQQSVNLTTVICPQISGLPVKFGWNTAMFSCRLKYTVLSIRPR